MITSLGQKRANPSANKENNLKLPLDPNEQTARDVLSYTTANTATITSFTYQGVEVPLPAGLTLTPANLISVRDAMWEYLKTREVNPEIKVWHDGTDLLFIHTGSGTVSALKVGGTNRPTSRKAILLTLASNVIYIKGSIPALLKNGVAEALPNTPYAYTGVLATDETTATELETDLAAALTTLVTPNTTVSVEVRPEKETYKVVIKSPAANLFVMAGKTLAQNDFENVLV